MIRAILVLLITSMAMTTIAQPPETMQTDIQNSAQRLISGSNKLAIGGYGEVHYNQPLNSETRNNGSLDVHRMVLLVGYKFNKRTQFITEIEFEHVKEVYVEQAFIQYKINDYINFRGGLLLTPMGIINEYHEPTAFNGVERPLIDKYISPTTWREIGFGFTGNIFTAKMRYQVYLINGFSSYNDTGNLDGKNGLRKGRQKGAESFISSPNYSGKIEFYGVRGLNVGVSGYFGDTQSKLYNGIDKNDKDAITKADSSVAGISMVGLDARYSFKGLQLRGQFYLTELSNTKQYNVFTATDGKLNDLGSSMYGYYVEAGYNIFRLAKNIKTGLIPFVRYETYNTHNSVEDGIEVNKAYNNTIVTTGLTWKLANGAVLKADIQFFKSKADLKYTQVFNAGFGVMF